MSAKALVCKILGCRRAIGAKGAAKQTESYDELTPMKKIEGGPMTGDSDNWAIDWKLPRNLTAPEIEGWIANLPPTTKEVSFRLGAWHRTGPFADARLQSALCLLHRRNITTKAMVPTITLSGERAHAAFGDPNPLAPSNPLTPTELQLAGSVAGLAIGQLCSFDKAHHQIPELQRQTLTRRRYLFGWGDELALVVPTETQPTGFPRKSALEREAAFNNRLEDLLRPLGVTTENARPATVYWFNQLKSFAFEASENTWDHGRLNFDRRPIRSLRFVRLRRIDIEAKGFNMTEAVPGFEDTFQEYVRSLSSAHNLTHQRHHPSVRLIEVTVADGGVGIAAKMARGFHIFEGPLETEARYLLNALLPDGTTKDPSEAGRGQGLGKMLQACFRLSGLLVVRTGRLSAWRTYRQPDGSDEEVDFEDTSSNAYLLNLNDISLPLLAGTSVSLIFPIDASSARRSFYS